MLEMFPGSLKLARVLPVFKEGDQQDCFMKY